MSEKLYAKGKFLKADDSILKQSLCKVSSFWAFWAHSCSWKGTTNGCSGKFKVTKRFLFRSVFPLGVVWGVMCKLWLESRLGLREWESPEQKLQRVGKLLLKKTRAENNGALLSSLNPNSRLHPSAGLSLAKDIQVLTSREFTRGEFLPSASLQPLSDCHSWLCLSCSPCRL